MSRTISRAAWYVLLAVVVALVLAPALWMLSTSIKPEREIITTQIRWIPQNFTVEHFQAIVQNYPMMQWLFNSLFTATAATLLVLVLDSMAGYAFARMEFRGRGLLFMIVLSMLFVPIQITVVPLFILFSRLGLTDTYWALILPVGANVTGVFLMRQFFLSIPGELEEAARVDGASAFRVFWSVVLPLARPALTAVAIITFLSTWNSFFWPLIVTRSDSVRTLPVGIAQFLSLRAGMVQGQMSIGQSMAGAVFAALPPIIIFVILQRYFIEGISRTGIKG
ncbi:MAG: carbohydrate ABC transporter permease [Chloroflexi bacterium]|nr:carbohydrate ABC transporter permease [Chloroflexota bacterium]MDL1882905.1 carbohydrate ABC transporter permease [Anaerolineae bacterium CFX8]GIL13839.1 MAG: sugar ABC transporter permease [Chloroflexota bacterium]